MAAAQENKLLIDAASHAQVPTYSGCRDKALKKFIQSGLLQQELNRSADFNEAWAASKGCSKEIPGKLKEHSTALRVFQDERNPFSSVFDEAVEKLSVNASTYEDQFQFKSFYFLLMDLMTKVPPSQCKTGFISTDQVVKNGSSVRFKRFVKADIDTKYITELDENSLLNITSCFYVGANVCNSHDSLIFSPAEVFLVVDVKSVTADDTKYTQVVLKHQSVESSPHCSMFSR